MQQLTERQCWDAIRELVSAKNTEYSKFLTVQIGAHNLPTANGYTKNVYLQKFNLQGEGDFKELIRRSRGITPKREWLNNLSAEDLLLFLDFICRSMQAMYDYASRCGMITLDIIQQFISKTKRSALIEYNAARLKATGVPAKVEDEVELDKLDMTREEIYEQALLQTMKKIAIKYCELTNEPLDYALDVAGRLTTTTTYNGKTIGHKLKSVLKIETKDKQVDESKIHLAGFDIDKAPVFMRDGFCVDIFNHIIEPVEVVYDVNKNLIKDEMTPKHRFIGLDIQGTPIYEDEDGYFNSLGDRLPDDVYIDRTCEDGLGYER